MKTNITYKEISEKIDKSEHTIKQWKQRFPKLLNFVKIGVFCENNNLDIEKIKKLVEVQEAVKGVEG